MREHEADLLDSAADLLEKRGWVKGNERGEGTGSPTEDPVGYCTIGAVHRAAAAQNMLVYLDATYRLLERYLHGTYFPGTGRYSIICWNDNPATTKQQVLDTLRACAKELRK